MTAEDAFWHASSNTPAPDMPTIEDRIRAWLDTPFSQAERDWLVEHERMNREAFYDPWPSQGTVYRVGTAHCDRCGSLEVVLGNIGTGEWLCVVCRYARPVRPLTWWERLRAALGAG